MNKKDFDYSEEEYEEDSTKVDNVIITNNSKVRVEYIVFYLKGKSYGEKE